jgi:hypothetical protein
MAFRHSSFAIPSSAGGRRSSTDLDGSAHRSNPATPTHLGRETASSLARRQSSGETAPPRRLPSARPPGSCSPPRRPRAAPGDAHRTGASGPGSTHSTPRRLIAPAAGDLSLQYDARCRRWPPSRLNVSHDPECQSMPCRGLEAHLRWYPLPLLGATRSAKIVCVPRLSPCTLLCRRPCEGGGEAAPGASTRNTRSDRQRRHQHCPHAQVRQRLMMSVSVCRRPLWQLHLSIGLLELIPRPDNSVRI